MAQRNTRTGGRMERMVLEALENGGYRVCRNFSVDSGLGVGKSYVDICAEDSEGRPHLLSLKWQQVGGTTEQKIPFEIIRLTAAMLSDERFYKSYLVLGGDGWKDKEFYISGGLDPYLSNSDLVNVVSLDAFVSKANRGQL